MSEVYNTVELDDPFSDDENICTELKIMYKAICSRFKRKTGLTVELGFHDHDNQGDCYDDIIDHYWEITNGYWEKTMNGHNADRTKMIEQKSFVTWG